MTKSLGGNAVEFIFQKFNIIIVGIFKFPNLNVKISMLHLIKVVKYFSPRRTSEIM